MLPIVTLNSCHLELFLSAAWQSYCISFFHFMDGCFTPLFLKATNSVSRYHCQLSTVFSMYLRKQKQSISLIPMTMPSYLPAFMPIYSAFQAVIVNELSILSFSICRLDPIPCCFSHYFSCITILSLYIWSLVSAHSYF